MFLNRISENQLFWASILLVIAAAVYIVMILYRGEILEVYWIGAAFPPSPFLDGNIADLITGKGHDGKFFLSIALDPLLQHPDSLLTMDRPVYRYRRILYPVLGYAFGWGNFSVIPYSLYAINVGALCGILYFVKRYLSLTTSSVHHYLYLLCIPGVWLCLAMGTAELLTVFFIVGAILFHYKEQTMACAVMLVGATLTRETAALAMIAFLLVTFQDKEYRKMLIYGLAGVPFTLWNLYVFFRLRGIGDYGIADNFGWPLGGIVEQIMLLIADPSIDNVVYSASIGLIFLGVLAIVQQYLSNRNTYQLPFIIGMLYLVVVLMSSISILGLQIDTSRVFVIIAVLAVMVGNKNKWFLVYSMASLIFSIGSIYLIPT